MALNSPVTPSNGNPRSRALGFTDFSLILFLPINAPKYFLRLEDLTPTAFASDPPENG
jgi:hypothetical protein